MSIKAVTTAVIGYKGIEAVNKHSELYQEGDFQEGSKELVRANAILAGLALTNEALIDGSVGPYTAIQPPYLLGGLREFFKHHPEAATHPGLKKIIKMIEGFGPTACISLNVVIQAGLILGEFVDPSSLTMWFRQIGFAGLSTAYVMPTEGPGVSSKLTGMTAKQERFAATSGTRTLLSGVLLYEAVPSLYHAVSHMSLNEVNWLALIWCILNFFAIKRDITSLYRELSTSKTIDETRQKISNIEKDSNQD